MQYNMYATQIFLTVMYHRIITGEHSWTKRVRFQRDTLVVVVNGTRRRRVTDIETGQCGGGTA